MCIIRTITTVSSYLLLDLIWIKGLEKYQRKNISAKILPNINVILFELLFDSLYSLHLRNTADILEVPIKFDTNLRECTLEAKVSLDLMVMSHCIRFLKKDYGPKEVCLRAQR